MTTYNGSLVKNSALSVEQISDIKKSVIVSLRSKERFWDAFCSHDKVGDGYSAYEWRKLNLTKVTDGDIANLTEGVTPNALSMTYVSFKETPVDFGTYIEYTDKAKKYNFDNVVADAKVVLAQHAHEVTECKKAEAYTSGTCTMDLTSGTNHFLKDLLKARTILKKNNVKPISNNKYGCILPPEVAAEVLLDYSTSITHTSQKEALINGYLGELGGFILYENADAAMYKYTSIEAAVAGTPLANTASGTADVDYYTRASSSDGAGYLNDGTYKYTFVGTGTSVTADAANKYYPLTKVGHDIVARVLFIGKTEYGMPVRTIAFGDASVQVFDSGLGDGTPQVELNNSNVVTAIKGDPLHQRGTVGYKVMGFATNILFDEAVIRGEYKIEAYNSLSVTDANRDGYQASNTSPS